MRARLSALGDVSRGEGEGRERANKSPAARAARRRGKTSSEILGRKMNWTAAGQLLEQEAGVRSSIVQRIASPRSYL